MSSSGQPSTAGCILLRLWPPACWACLPSPAQANGGAGLSQADLVRMAFAGDDVAAQFAAAKAEEVQGELPKVRREWGVHVCFVHMFISGMPVEGLRPGPGQA
jgi:hypothetical protein